MASTGARVLDPEPVLRLVKGPRMFNRQLISICKAEGISATGIKAELQNRICSIVNRYAVNGDVAAFERLKALLESHTSQQESTIRHGQNHFSMSPAASSPNTMGGNANGYRPNPHREGLHITFKPSPFYTILQQIGETKVCEIMAQHRHTVKMELTTASHPILANAQTDPSIRVMLFSASEMRPGTVQFVQFPYQSEIKVNGGELKANLRGLKNKPGSTRPIDITESLRLKPSGYSNTIEMTYALTDKELLNAVKIVSVSGLVELLKRGRKISKNSVISQMATKARDPDIVATSTVLSLKCPLSTLRIELPCRSILCRHNQCFDGTSYLQLQEQGPTWQCPICNTPAPFDNLAVDEYVQDILSSTSKSVDQVTIEPDGTWTHHAKPNSSTSMGGGDDDLIEIKETRVSSIKIGNGSSSTPPRTPQAASRGPSVSQITPNTGTNKKRPISQVIDLTLSDGEDDEPRAPKRQLSTSAYNMTPKMFPGT